MAGSMLTLPVISSRTRKFLVVSAALSLALTTCGCRRGSGKSANANGAGASSNESATEQSKREAQSLLDKGKELYGNDQDEQAADALQQAVRLNPDLAEAHLRLGMAYAA